MPVRDTPSVLTPVRPRDRAVRLFDALHHAWERPGMERAIGATLVAAFLGAMVAIELARRGLLPAAVVARLPRSHFAAVGVAFTLLLVVETLSLVFALAQSVADAVGKQFELLSVILLRKTFLAFADVHEPVDWARAAGAAPEAVADMTGALLVFVITGLFYRAQRHRPITTGESEQASFIAAKKGVALALLAAFAVMIVDALADAIRGATPAPSVHGFFEAFYTVLIFSDVLLVLVALCYSSRYAVVFRNSGFAAATLLLRIALTAPPFVNAALGVGAALFGVAVSMAYNVFTTQPGWIVAGDTEDASSRRVQ